MANSEIPNFFVAEVSDEDAKYIYAVRARTEAAAKRKIKAELKEAGTENIKDLRIEVTQYFLRKDVTCISSS